jgi:hypothetical protein
VDLLLRSRDPPNSVVSEDETDADPAVLEVRGVSSLALDGDDDVVLVTGTEPTVREQFVDLLTEFAIVEFGIPDAGGTFRPSDVLSALGTDHRSIRIPGWRADNWRGFDAEPTES